MANGDYMKARSEMAYAQYLAGIAFNNASLGYVHAMAHQLGGFYNLPHGVCNAILLPYVEEFNLIGNLNRFRDMAEAMGENITGLSTNDAALKCIAFIRNLAKQAERPPLPAPDSPETEALKAQAKAELPGRVAYWSKIMGVQPTGVRITTARKRYGSCSSKHSLCFSCYLMRSPEAAVDLVVVHELCHIREMNHGPRFYALLEQYLPDWKERKKLLK